MARRLCTNRTLSLEIKHFTLKLVLRLLEANMLVERSLPIPSDTYSLLFKFLALQSFIADSDMQLSEWKALRLTHAKNLTDDILNITTERPVYYLVSACRLRGSAHDVNWWGMLFPSY